MGITYYKKGKCTIHNGITDVTFLLLGRPGLHLTNLLLVYATRETNLDTQNGFYVFAHVRN